MAYFLGPPCI